jgi:two-component system sensor kinase FixL
MSLSLTNAFRSAVEREITKYGALQAVAQLATDPFTDRSGVGMNTQLLGETLERLYPAVDFVAFVRVVDRASARDFLHRRGLTASPDGSGAKDASSASAVGAPSPHYFLESVSPRSPRGFRVGTDLAAVPEFARNLERATKVDSLLVMRDRVERGRSLPGALVIFGIESPSTLSSTTQAVDEVQAMRGMPLQDHGQHSSTPLPRINPSTKTPSPARIPFGFLIVGIDMIRLMNEAMRELPPSWHARLTALPEEGVGRSIDVGGRKEGSKLLFDSHLEMPAGTLYPPVRPELRMDPYRFHAWGAHLLLEMEGHEEDPYPYLDLMPWMVLLAAMAATAALYMGFTRIRNARLRVRALAREVRTSAERFRDMVETSSDWIWEVDEQYRFTYLSPTTEGLLGYAQSELMGTSLLALLASTAEGESPSRIFPVQDGGVVSYTNFERRMRRKDGTEVVFESAGTPIKDDSGTTVGFRGIDRDVTQQREFRVRLSQLHEDLARHMQSNLAGQLLSGLAHELNQPLAAILTYNQACLRLLQSGNADPSEIVAAMKSTADNVVHARDILQRLRRFTARREPHVAPTPLAPMVRNCLGLIEIRLRSQAVEVLIDIPDTLPQVLADPILAAQVFLNVFNNAIDAMVDAQVRQITVRASAPDGRSVLVQVEDSGPGIAAEHLPRIFDAYFTTKPEGTGIGLPLCRSIIEAMGGSIKVSSEPGKGAVVHLTFPSALME